MVVKGLVGTLASAMFRDREENWQSAVLLIGRFLQVCSSS